MESLIVPSPVVEYTDFAWSRHLVNLQVYFMAVELTEIFKHFPAGVKQQGICWHRIEQMMGAVTQLIGAATVQGMWICTPDIVWYLSKHGVQMQRERVSLNDMPTLLVAHRCFREYFPPTWNPWWLDAEGLKKQPEVSLWTVPPTSDELQALSEESTAGSSADQHITNETIDMARGAVQTAINLVGEQLTARRDHLEYLQWRVQHVDRRLLGILSANDVEGKFPLRNGITACICAISAMSSTQVYTATLPNLPSTIMQCLIVRSPVAEYTDFAWSKHLIGLQVDSVDMELSEIFKHFPTKVTQQQIFWCRIEQMMVSRYHNPLQVLTCWRGAVTQLIGAATLQGMWIRIPSHIEHLSKHGAQMRRNGFSVDDLPTPPRSYLDVEEHYQPTWNPWWLDAERLECEPEVDSWTVPPTYDKLEALAIRDAKARAEQSTAGGSVNRRITKQKIDAARGAVQAAMDLVEMSIKNQNTDAKELDRQLVFSSCDILDHTKMEEIKRSLDTVRL
ncbi:hypothetical protein HYDPIDRAFT_32106 [Hydnomerulius pinastri MD-312]|uniref:Uncharacterized protein n=1 Tax=Hydnomerulius pinastri MD-312 TaxID=994086 RepID=A0A0C9WAU4_9AGAM|nr:hypothetical protein HYDPIDRAFT_32106 [Hydnomerulius pinastri MD-312]